MKTNWLSLSLFCDISQWNAIYRDIIFPMSKSKTIIKWNAKCKLFDERHRLDLYLCVQENFQEKIVMSLDKKLKNKLSSFPNNGVSQYPPFSNEVLFMPFPLNTVQYGLFRVSREKDNYLDKILKYCTKTIIKNESTFEDLLTLLFNLYGFILFQMADGNSEFITLVLKKIEQTDRVIEKTDFRILYDSEKELFIELFNSIRVSCDVSIEYFLKQTIGIRTGRVVLDWGREKPLAIRVALAIKYFEKVSAYLLTSNFIKWSVLTAINESILELQEAELAN